ncbi:hypothetical protein IFO69_08575 [Echinicola sp. CAU 1574]|uniref:Uncharacterized protein n=1 Tax=Echinicola arenosa TaxID=2774144 RepID=A0ABR9AJ59_9BACT|nr:hypothetical protein [Echinicola arenosa]MBD8488797.1 hypothetical protein [Echinicola arenosa]
MKKKKKLIKELKEEVTEEWDVEDGFGGLPDDLDLSKNIGCASNKNKKRKDD